MTYDKAGKESGKWKKSEELKGEGEQMNEH